MCVVFIMHVTEGRSENGYRSWVCVCVCVSVCVCVYAYACAKGARPGESRDKRVLRCSMPLTNLLASRGELSPESVRSRESAPRESSEHGHLRFVWGVGLHRHQTTGLY